MLPRPIVLGYRGCPLTVARRVVAGKDGIHPSSNDYDWLGHGIYFWVDDPKRAREWAGNKDDSPAGVLGTAIDLGRCLHLADRNCLEYLREAYERVVRSCEQRGVPIPVNSGKRFGNRKLDCAVFEAVHDLRATRGLPAFDTVAAYFVEGGELYPGAAIRALDHIQICVRNPKRILGWFLPPKN